mmetsp:Transcript_1375/g.1810  ORF Transcript_1375/g.1810 Transcript_1375/m.1810 type:complete len:125 (+) Transcript_1375:41-415(+)
MDTLRTAIIRGPEGVTVNGIPEWNAIELQGQLVVESLDEGSASMDGQLLGGIKFKQDGTPVLEIGYHSLQGTVVKVKKPFAVIERVKSTPETQGAEFKVVGIVRKKYMFCTRPKPIVGKRLRVS